MKSKKRRRRRKRPKEEVYITRLCAYPECRRLFRANPIRKLYCSPECSRADYRRIGKKGAIIVCRICGAQITATRTHQRVCDKIECRRAWKEKWGFGEAIENIPTQKRKCLRCDKEFTPQYKGNWFCQQCLEANRKVKDEEYMPEDWGARELSGWELI